ncbi:hypothetical protein ACETK8_20060 (plasmid) [Brevundimonas staleyi]|uniref:Uncharacterized protein n=1 Tax=Brevundimonas staleyi TaxID=74326 RepID=A0ABW0FMN9_9CAUL
MPDFYTKLCFDLACAPEEADRLVAAFGVTGATTELPPALAGWFASPDPTDPLSGIAVFYDGADAFDVGAWILPIEGGVRIWAQGDPQLVAIAEFIRTLAPSVLPVGFTWCNDCSRARPGAFGGGFALISAEGCDFNDVSGLLEDAMEAARG